MNQQTNVSVLSILIIYMFFTIISLLSVKYLAYYFENIDHLVWSLIAILIILFSRYAAFSTGSSFKCFLGNMYQDNDIKGLIGLSVVFFLIGVGSSAFLVYCESLINIEFAIKKWGFISSKELEQIQWNPYWVIVTLINAIIVIPITEEIVFRGLILNRLYEKYNMVIAVFISSLIFAIFHYNKNYIGSFLHGVILAIVAIKYASLYYPMFIHGIYNGVIFYVSKFNGVLFAVDIEKINQFYYWLPEFICLLVGILLSIFYYKKLHIKNNSPKEEKLLN